MSIASGFQSQFDRGSRMIDQTIRATPENVCRIGGRIHVCPARPAYHTAETIDSYLEGAENFRWGCRFSGDWEGMSTDELPSRDACREYLREAKANMAAWLDNHRNNEIRAEPSGYPSCGENHFELALYVLRHAVHRHGEMHALAVRAGSDADDWE